MTVMYLGESDPLVGMIYGKEYKVLGIEEGWYRIVDESCDDYIYPPGSFEIVDESGKDELPNRYMGEEYYETAREERREEHRTLKTEEK